MTTRSASAITWRCRGISTPTRWSPSCPSRSRSSRCAFRIHGLLLADRRAGALTMPGRMEGSRRVVELLDLRPVARRGRQGHAAESGEVPDAPESAGQVTGADPFNDRPHSTFTACSSRRREAHKVSWPTSVRVSNPTVGLIRAVAEKLFLVFQSFWSSRRAVTEVTAGLSGPAPITASRFGQALLRSPPDAALPRAAASRRCRAARRLHRL